MLQLLFLAVVVQGLVELPFRKKILLPKNVSFSQRDDNSPLYGGVSSTLLFIVNIRFGHQYFSLQVDSGSSGTSVPLLACHVLDSDKPCTSPSPGYVASHCHPCTLSFAMAGHCTKDQELGVCATHHLGYADGSRLDGVLVTDVLHLGDLSNPQYTLLGAQTRKGFASFDIDGIMGLAYSRLDPYAGSNSLSALGMSKFSFCGGDQGGRIVFSEDEGKLNTYGRGPPQFTPLDRGYNFYAVFVDAMGMGSHTVNSQGNLRGYRSIVDTGTTLLLLENEIFMKIRSIAYTYYSHLPGFNEESSVFNRQCFRRSFFSVPFSQYPNITVTVPNNLKLNVSASSYFLYNRESDCYWLGLGACRGCGIVLGDVFLKSFVTIFDRQNSQVGFAPVDSSCEMTTAKNPGSIVFSNWTKSFPAGRWTSVKVKTSPKNAGQLTVWTTNSTSMIISKLVPVDEHGIAENFMMGTLEKYVKVSVTIGTAPGTSGVFVVGAYEAEPNPNFQSTPTFIIAVTLIYVAIIGFYMTTFCFQVRKAAK